MIFKMLYIFLKTFSVGLLKMVSLCASLYIEVRSPTFRFLHTLQKRDLHWELLLLYIKSNSKRSMVSPNSITKSSYLTFINPKKKKKNQWKEKKRKGKRASLKMILKLLVSFSKCKAHIGIFSVGVLLHCSQNSVMFCTSYSFSFIPVPFCEVSSHIFMMNINYGIQ